MCNMKCDVGKACLLSAKGTGPKQDCLSALSIQGLGCSHSIHIHTQDLTQPAHT